ncbi:MAG: hypothetical protein JXQ27_13005 [Acidobacteria bacterium]|nr:hypothetical protein [Acidobacteriota bacterium]
MPLKCKRCGRPLTGLPQDVVFVCTDCGQAFPFSFWLNLWQESREGQVDLDSPAARLIGEYVGLPHYPVLVWTDPHPQSQPCLPFWLFVVRPEFTTSDTQKQPRYESLCRDLYLLVPAFSFHGLQYIGCPGQELPLDRRPPLADGPVALRGAARDPFTAFVMAWHLILRQADRLADISNVAMSVRHTETALVAVPFTVTGDRLVLPFSERRYPVCYFDDLPALQTGT